MPEKKTPLLLQARGFLDTLVFAYVLAMFFRTFLFELFMIPTGSMTPTLIGDAGGEAVLMDYNGDGIKDVVMVTRHSIDILVYVMGEDGFPQKLVKLRDVPGDYRLQLARRSPARKDMILVNKFAYFFKVPERGDIAIFKVPDRPDLGHHFAFDPYKPIFIKRVTGLPGEEVILQNYEEKVVSQGSAEFLGKLEGLPSRAHEVHITPNPMIVDGKPLDPASDTARVPHYGQAGMQHYDRFKGIWYLRVPDDAVLMMGDNQQSSSDSRFWGPVALDQMRGRAVLRYWPLDSRTFLNPVSNGTIRVLTLAVLGILLAILLVSVVRSFLPEKKKEAPASAKT